MLHCLQHDRDFSTARRIRHVSLFKINDEETKAIAPAYNPAHRAPALSYRIESDVVEKLIPLLEELAEGQDDKAIDALYALIDFDIQKNNVEGAYGHLDALFSITDASDYDSFKLHAQAMSSRFVALKEISSVEQYQKISALKKGIDRGLLHAGRIAASSMSLR